MKSIIQLVKSTNFYKKLRERDRVSRLGRVKRRLSPTAEFKQKVVREHAKKFQVKILVETGTYQGDMVEASRSIFDKIYTIELSKELYEKAIERFSGMKNIELIHGDSSVELAKIVDKLTQPVLFWLDGHYSGGITAKGTKNTPVYEELLHLLHSQVPNHIILIDDARAFGKEKDYPSLEDVRALVKSTRSNMKMTVKHDIIRIVPKKWF